jgi:hypothetical protein
MVFSNVMFVVIMAEHNHVKGITIQNNYPKIKSNLYISRGVTLAHAVV